MRTSFLEDRLQLVASGRIGDFQFISDSPQHFTSSNGFGDFRLR
jgi:hypothetical protein